MTDKYEAVAADVLGADAAGVPLTAAVALVGLQAGDAATARGLVVVSRGPAHRSGRGHGSIVEVDGRTALELDVADGGVTPAESQTCVVKVDASGMRNQPEVVVVVLIVVFVVVVASAGRVDGPFGAKLGPQMNLQKNHTSS